MAYLLITGSRKASKRMLSLVPRVVGRANLRGDEIMVGDASGTDAAVIAECDKQGVNVWVYCTHPNGPRTGVQTHHNLMCTMGSHTARDRMMADACDYCVAIWTGQVEGERRSPGTHTTFLRVITRHLPVYVWNDSLSQWVNYNTPG